MKISVVRGILSPSDSAKKTGRFGLLIKTGNEAMVIPCTSYAERTGTTPRGNALLTEKSPAYKASGFTKSIVAIDVRNYFIAHVESQYLEEAEQVGVLNLDKDNRLKAEIMELMKFYAPKSREELSSRTAV